MKVLLLALAVLSASVGTQASVAKSAESRFIDGIIIGVIEDFIDSLVERGLDPIVIENEHYKYQLPVTDLFVAEAILDQIVVRGISDIVIHNMDFSVLAVRLRFDIALLGVEASVGSAYGRARLGNWEVDAQASGNLKVENVRVHGEVRLNLLGGVSIRDINLNFGVEDIHSNLNVVVLGHDISEPLNHILGDVIPEFLNEFGSDINRIIEYIIERIVEDLLD